ncbi:MAG: hypothetical protein EBU54_08715 [Mycobacteriaceae bacterium]|nr:hypothetical protein [Mycobacteriaceae bacterium]
MSQHGAVPENLSDEQKLMQLVYRDRLQREQQAQQAQRARRLKQYASIGGIVVGTIMIILACSFYYGDLQKHKKTKSTSKADFHPGRDIGLLAGGFILVALGSRSVYLPPASK